MAEHKFDYGQKIMHEQFGAGEINGKITLKARMPGNKVMLLKDGYNVIFLETKKTLFVREKEIRLATIEEWREWTSRFKINF